MNSSTTSNSLRTLAKQAKNRLRSCNNRSEVVNYRGYESLNNNYNAYEKIMYAKVVQMLESNENVLNPLTRLVDHSTIASCDDATKQKMMLEASKMFVKLKQKYYETTANMG